MNKYDVSQHSPDYWFKAGQFSFAFNMPDPVAATSRRLPPYHGRRIFLVDEYPACPSHWLPSQGRILSVFVPIVHGKAAWLDFNQCYKAATDVAVVVSVQGVNAITYQRCENAQLEQFLDQCPTHHKPFGPHRLCTDCGFKWPRQNYLATTGTPEGTLWLDGFRRPDGSVSQYILSVDKSRTGVAEAVIGNERVHALGLSFFGAKTPKPQKPIFREDYFASALKGIGGSGLKSLVSEYYTDSLTLGGGSKGFAFGGDTLKSFSGSGVEISCASHHGEIHARSTRTNVEVEDVEVVPGNSLDQVIHDDLQPLDYWQEQPEVVVIVNYCSEDEADAIIAAGKVDVSGDQAGMLGKLRIEVGV